MIEDRRARERRRRSGGGRALTALALVLAAAGPAGAQSRALERGRDFWLALAKDCRPPAGETAAGLVGEAVTLLGSPDTVWRDDVGFGVVASCVYQARALSPAERRALTLRLTANLRHGIGATADDTVLLRSFSALDLSVVAAVEIADPGLDAAGYRALLDAALTYLRDERDLRGLEPRVGWIHATAHTADLLKQLARDPRLARGDQARLFDAVWARLTSPGVPVFTHAEDERLAAALAAVIRRDDFDPLALRAFLTRFAPLEAQVWSKAPPDPAVLDAMQNARQFLRALYVVLSLPSPGPKGKAPSPATPTLERARQDVLETLGSVRRS